MHTSNIPFQLILSCACLTWLSACSQPVMKPSQTDAQLQQMAQMVFQPLPERVPAQQALVDLGRKLYFDGRLSSSGTISCNSCHALNSYGVDGKPTSTGFKGQLGSRNSPTVYHAFLHLSQFWDGRSPNVEDQAKGPILNPVEMAMPDAASVRATLRKVPEYRQGFAAAFGGLKDPVNLTNAAIAIGAFERGLIAPSRLDQFLRGDLKALTPPEKEGLKTFVQVGCASCHSGVAIGGNSYQKMGLKNPYPNKDTGRFQVTALEADRGSFKVPSLRNITETGPYFHQGQIATLAEAVTAMGHYQLDKELTPNQVASLLTFLTALKGQLPREYIAAPRLP